jgi:hypothetical protein
MYRSWDQFFFPGGPGNVPATASFDDSGRAALSAESIIVVSRIVAPTSQLLIERAVAFAAGIF